MPHSFCLAWTLRVSRPIGNFEIEMFHKHVVEVESGIERAKRNNNHSTGQVW